MKIVLNAKSKDSKVKDTLEIYDDTLIKVTDEKNRVVYKGIVDYAPKDIRDGRWHKGPNNKTFTINTEKGVLTVKVLDSSIRDSLQLKTYKIKNHDSGLTYTVRAATYKDAVNKYNQFITQDSITEDADKSMGTYNGYSIKQNIDGDIYVLKKSGEKEFFESWKKAYEAIKSGAIKDSLTEDAISKLVQNYLSSKNPKTKAEQDEIINFLLERNKITKEDVQKVRSLLKIVKDAITEDSEYSNEERNAVKLIRNMKRNSTTSEIVKALKKNFNLSPSVIQELLETELNIRLALSEIKDSLTEDADIAQTDIKSTYLPEDANADNIQYLGFNEKRKLSFYSYGDRYFVHYDLEGRTEEIDKETVQKILKKNILGEIDENDLINKEPQSEEIVSDAFDWQTKQERGDK